jgi:predicted nucleic acid-binding protein
MEVLEGILDDPDPEILRAKLETFARRAPVIPLTVPLAHATADLRYVLRKQNKRVRNRPLDLIIAATALHHGPILVTRNRNDYKDIPGLHMH